MKFSQELMFLVNKPQSFLEVPLYADVFQRLYHRHLQEDPYENHTERLFFNCVKSQCSNGKGLELGLFKLYISGNVDLFLRLCFCFYKKGDKYISFSYSMGCFYESAYVCVCACVCVRVCVSLVDLRSISMAPSKSSLLSWFLKLT